MHPSPCHRSKDRHRHRQCIESFDYFVLAGIGLIATPVRYQRKTASSPLILALLLIMFIAKILMKQGKTRLSGLLVLSSVWLVFSLIILFGGGLDNINVLFYVSWTVLAGLLFGERATLWVTVISIFGGLGVGFDGGL
jgi:hypothetical protein